MISNNKKTDANSNKLKYVLTMAIGMLVLFWRVLLPQNTEISVGTVVLVMTLDLALMATVIFLSRKELAEVFAKKFTIKDGLKALLVFVLSYIVSIGTAIIMNTLGMLSLVQGEVSPTQFIVMEYMRLFPIGLFISTVITAPIWEEIVFRMLGKKVINNSILYIIITSLLFAFIHSVNFSLADNFSNITWGAFMAIAYLKVKDVRILMLAHFMTNLMAFVLQMIK